MTFDRITTAGAGTMGSQVAWQMAFHGKRVTVYDARYLDEQFIRKGRLGVATGQGFYSYPHPAFAQPGFLR